MNRLARPTTLPSLDPIDALRNRDTGWRLRHEASIRLALGIVMAVLAPVAALLIELDLAPVLGGWPSAIPTIAAILIVASFGGVVPGLLATIVAVALEWSVLMPGSTQLGPDSGPDRLQVAMLAGTGLLVDALAWFRARAERRAMLAQRNAEDVLGRANTAARRLEALQGLATDLAEAGTVDDILTVLLDRACAALQADSCAVGGLGEADELRDVASLVLEPPSGSQDTVRKRLEPLLVAVLRTGEPLFNEGRSSWGPTPGRAVAAVPVGLSAGPGVMWLAWNRAHPLPPDRQAFIGSLARAATTAIDRHRMFAAEVAALRRAEAATGFLNILADAGRVLGTTLEYEDMVGLLPGLGIPQLGDVGILDLEEGGKIRRIVATHDPGLDPAARLLERHPMAVKGTGVAVEALMAGRAAAYRLDDEAISKIRGREQSEAVHQLGPGWVMLLPLVIQGATTGMLTFMRRAETAFDPGELAVAEELGRRAGRALEMARLHQQVEDLAELERRRAGELEAVLAAVEEGFILADSRGVIQSYNNAAARLLGGPVRNLGELHERLLDAAGRTPHALSSQPEELRLRHRPNAWVEISTYPVGPSSPGTPSVVIVCRDVTAFRRGQALREAFLGLLSHELRTPVTTIYAAAALLTRRGHELDREVADEVLADVATEADRLYRLIEDLMVLAKFDEGIDLGSQPVLLQHLVPAAVSQESTRWPGVTLHCQTEPDLATVSGDETAIAQVVRNLLSNAAKYSPVGGRVDVAIRPDGDGVAVVVRDQGPGIDPAEAEKIFDPFYRSPSTAGLASGAGIGLYVSRRLVDAMGGRIAAVPVSGGGSEFTFVLPPYEPDEAA